MSVKLLVLVIDDEPDVEGLFRQQFRRELRTGRFTMDFAQSAAAALQHITDAGTAWLILILSDINIGAEAMLTKPIDFVILRNEIETRVESAA
jgi:CheY-like chemotaxis protein